MLSSNLLLQIPLISEFKITTDLIDSLTLLNCFDGSISNTRNCHLNDSVSSFFTVDSRRLARSLRWQFTVRTEGEHPVTKTKIICAVFVCKTRPFVVVRFAVYFAGVEENDFSISVVQWWQLLVDWKQSFSPRAHNRSRTRKPNDPSTRWRAIAYRGTYVIDLTSTRRLQELSSKQMRQTSCSW